MTLEGDTSAITNCGQFVNIQLDGLYLRRPISVCDVTDGLLTVIYKVVGKGTEQMSEYSEGKELRVLCGLGNGYDLSKSGDSPLLIGGGVGVPPMYLLAKELIKKAVIMLKKYAMDYHTFVIGIVATNRASNTAGKITLESGRDSSNIEFTADYQLGLNYEDLETGAVEPGDADKIAALQREPRRRMLLRILKSRLCAPGKAARVFFDAEAGTFYGAENSIFYPAPGNAAADPAESDPAEFAKLGTRKGTKRDKQRARFNEGYLRVKTRADATGEPVTVYALAEELDISQRQVINMLKEFGGYEVQEGEKVIVTGDIDLSKTVTEIPKITASF